MKLDVIGNEKPSAPWYAEGLKFTCTKCGNCCTGGPGYVWISREEIGRLAEFLRMSKEDVVEQYCRTVGQNTSLKENRNARGEYDCVFLKEEHIEGSATEGAEQVGHTKRTCTIYPVRPLQCRTWPFWEGTLSSPEVWETASKRCYGMNQGRRFTVKQIEALRDAKDWPKKPPTSREE